jgi:Na+/melibiose symporter-like transporter
MDRRPATVYASPIAFAGIPTLCYAAALLVIRSYPITKERHRLVLWQLAARVTRTMPAGHSGAIP